MTLDPARIELEPCDCAGCTGGALCDGVRGSACAECVSGRHGMERRHALLRHRAYLSGGTTGSKPWKLKRDGE